MTRQKIKTAFGNFSRIASLEFRIDLHLVNLNEQSGGK